MLNTISDTPAEVEQEQIRILRRLSDTERLNLAVQLSAHVWQLARRAFAERFPDASADEQLERFVSAQYGAAASALWRARKANPGDA